MELQFAIGIGSSQNFKLGLLKIQKPLYTHTRGHFLKGCSRVQTLTEIFRIECLHSDILASSTELVGMVWGSSYQHHQRWPVVLFFSLASSFGLVMHYSVLFSPRF